MNVTSETETVTTHRLLLEEAEPSVACEAEQGEWRARKPVVPLQVRGVSITRTSTKYSTRIRTVFTLDLAHMMSIGWNIFEWEIDYYHTMPSGLPPEWVEFIDLHIKPFTYADEVGEHKGLGARWTRNARVS